MIDGFFNLLLSVQQSTGSQSPWGTWPFGPGYNEGFWFTLSRFAFVAVVFVLISLFLRFLYGPKGKFRDKWIDEEAKAQKEKDLAELDARLERGEITKEQYEFKRKEL